MFLDYSVIPCSQTSRVLLALANTKPTLRSDVILLGLIEERRTGTGLDSTQCQCGAKGISQVV